MEEQLNDDEKKAVELALQAGKMSVMVVYDDIAEALYTTPDKAKDMLDNLVQRGVLCARGDGVRNVNKDENGKSNPVAWYTRW